jgi:hypothetical protein
MTLSFKQPELIYDLDDILYHSSKRCTTSDCLAQPPPRETWDLTHKSIIHLPWEDSRWSASVCGMGDDDEDGGEGGSKWVSTPDGRRVLRSSYYAAVGDGAHHRESDESESDPLLRRSTPSRSALLRVQSSDSAARATVTSPVFDPTLGLQQQRERP